MPDDTITHMTLADHELMEAPMPHRWRFEDFMRAAEAGIFDSQPVELIEGELIDMPAQKDPHAWAISRLTRELFRLFPDPYWVKIQSTQQLGDYSGPEPDITLLSGPPCPPALEKPRPLLIIEVSQTTLGYDRNRKASLYASHGINDYWIVNVIDRQVEVHRDPIPDSSQKHGWRFKSTKVLGLYDRVIPLCKPDLSLTVTSFLG